MHCISRIVLEIKKQINLIAVEYAKNQDLICRSISLTKLLLLLV